MAGRIRILETFRDAIQGMDTFIPTAVKIDVLRQLMEVGYDYLDAGSFVSPKLIPQFSDMDAVMDGIGRPPAGTTLFLLAGNVRGTEKACSYDSVGAIGFPFSTSETFLRKNINAGFPEGWSALKEIKKVCDGHGKQLIVYLAMAFGNPYGDPAGAAICLEWGRRLHQLGVTNIHLSDITGVATPGQAAEYFAALSSSLPGVELGIHLHVKDDGWKGVLREACRNGCSIIDGVISGLGGCPMTGYELVRNLPMDEILEFAAGEGLATGIDDSRFESARMTVLKQIDFT